MYNCEFSRHCTVAPQQQVNYLKVLTEHLGNAHDLAFLEHVSSNTAERKADHAAEALPS